MHFRIGQSTSLEQTGKLQWSHFFAQLYSHYNDSILREYFVSTESPHPVPCDHL